MEKELEIRIKRLEQRFDILSNQLNKALYYIEDDPHSSLTKSRTILEQILFNIYKLEMNQEPKRIELGAILTDNQFTRKIDKRIVSRMNAIRDMCNLGVHGEKVISKDAKIVLDNLCEVLEWYFENYSAVKTETDFPEQPLKINKTSKIKRKILTSVLLAFTVTITIIAVYYFLKLTIPNASSSHVYEKFKNNPDSNSSQQNTFNIERSTIHDTFIVNSNTFSEKSKASERENSPTKEKNKEISFNKVSTRVLAKVGDYFLGGLVDKDYLLSQIELTSTDGSEILDFQLLFDFQSESAISHDNKFTDDQKDIIRKTPLGKTLIILSHCSTGNLPPIILKIGRIENNFESQKIRPYQVDLINGSLVTDERIIIKSFTLGTFWGGIFTTYSFTGNIVPTNKIPPFFLYDIQANLGNEEIYLPCIFISGLIITR
jgi:hypothetical protein